jgi:hypothetical protein
LAAKAKNFGKQFQCPASNTTHCAVACPTRKKGHRQGATHPEHRQLHPHPDLLILEPKVFGESRGYFFESFNQQDFNQVTGLGVNFMQDNHSRSAQAVLRGLHHQVQ